MAIEYISLAVLIFVFCFYFIRQLAQIKVIKTEQFILLLCFIAMASILGSQVLLLGDKLSLLKFQKIVNPALGLTFSSFLAIVSLLAIPDTASGKQIKTLWRIPIIGVMAGMYFEFPYVTYICLGNILLAIGISYKRGPELRYLLVKLIPLLVPTLLMIILGINNLVVVNFWLLLILVLGAPIFNMANIHGLIKHKKLS